jgi:hypothetical protein
MPKQQDHTVIDPDGMSIDDFYAQFENLDHHNDPGDYVKPKWWELQGITPTPPAPQAEPESQPLIDPLDRLPEMAAK